MDMVWSTIKGPKKYKVLTSAYRIIPFRMYPVAARLEPHAGNL
jgi:hypothetical protein